MIEPEKNYYSKYKVFHHRHSLAAISKGKIPAPRQVQIDLCNACTHRCRYCYYTDEYKGEDASNRLDIFDPSAFIPTNKMMEIIDDLSNIGVGAVSLTGGGEPTIHPDFVEIVNRILRRGLKWSLTTNGSLIRKKRLSHLLTTATWVRFSIDAATTQTYIKSQRPTDETDFEALMVTIFNICRRKERPVVGTSFVVNPINHREVYDFVKMSKGLGVDNVRISLAYTSKKASIHTPYIEQVERDISRAKEDFEDRDFKIFSMMERYEDLKRNTKTYKNCYFHLFTCAISADMNVHPCCTTKGMRRYVIGSIKDRKFSEVWFGDDHREFIRNLDVSQCPPCWFDHQNEIISRIIENGYEREYSRLTEEQKRYVRSRFVPHVDWV